MLPFVVLDRPQFIIRNLRFKRSYPFRVLFLAEQHPPSVLASEKTGNASPRFPPNSSSSIRSDSITNSNPVEQRLTTQPNNIPPYSENIEQSCKYERRNAPIRKLKQSEYRDSLFQRDEVPVPKLHIDRVGIFNPLDAVRVPVESHPVSASSESSNRSITTASTSRRWWCSTQRRIDSERNEERERTKRHRPEYSQRTGCPTPSEINYYNTTTSMNTVKSCRTMDWVPSKARERCGTL